jgi:hypothetical protein
MVDGRHGQREDGLTEEAERSWKQQLCSALFTVRQGRRQICHHYRQTLRHRDGIQCEEPSNKKTAKSHTNRKRMTFTPSTFSLVFLPHVFSSVFFAFFVHQTLKSLQSSGPSPTIINDSSLVPRPTPPTPSRPVSRVMNTQNSWGIPFRLFTITSTPVLSALSLHNLPLPSPVCKAQD